MRALRTHYTDEAEFVRRVNEVQRPQGYRLVGAFDEDRAFAYLATMAGFGPRPSGSGANAKQAVAQVAADIRAIAKPEPYKRKGARYAGERVQRKAGKAGK